MKPIDPVDRYDDEGYPSVIDTELEHVSRRRFLRRALTASAAAGAALTLGRSSARAGKRRPRTYKTTLDLGSRYTFRHGNYELRRLAIQSRSEALIRFLNDRKQAAPIRKAIRKALDRHTCADVLDGKRLARAQRSVALALRKLYKKRTKRWVATPTAVFFVTVPRRYCKGKCAPTRPYCRVPARSRRKK